MPLPSDLSTSDRHRFRIRFRKQGDLRWISHRDLVRAIERLLRRAGLKMRMSDGYHPRPRMSFPSALALGIEGLDEVMEWELVESVDLQEIEQRLTSHAPDGFVISHVERMEPGHAKARVQGMVYRFPVPDHRRPRVRQAIERLMARPALLVEREGRAPVDLKADLESLELSGDAVCFRIRATHQASVRPRDVLLALELTDLEEQGYYLTRSEVELTS